MRAGCRYALLGYTEVYNDVSNKNDNTMTPQMNNYIIIPSLCEPIANFRETFIY